MKMKNKWIFVILVLFVVVLLGPNIFVGQNEKLVAVGYQEDIKGLNNYNPLYNDVWSRFVMGWCYETIYIWGPDYKPIPWLAKEPVNYKEKGGKIIATIKLRNDVKWWDGKPLTAEDAAFTYNLELKYRLPLQHTDFLIGGEPYVEKIEAIDKYTVQFTLTQPASIFETTLLADEHHGIIPKHQWEPIVESIEKKGGSLEEKAKALQDYEINTKNVIGAGPFKPTLWVRGSHMKLEANKEYFKKGEVIKGAGREFEIGPFVDGILIKVYKSLDAMTLAVKKGELDYIRWPIDPGRIAEFEGDPNIELPVSDDSGFFYLAFNFRRGPLDDPAFRKAFSYLVDKDLIVKRLLQGYGTPLFSPVVPGNAYWYNEDVPKYGADLTKEERKEKAREILSEAGYSWDSKGKLLLPNGKPMRQMNILTPPAGYDPVRAQAGILIQGWLNEVGIPITAQPTAFGTIVSKITPTEGLPDFDLYILGWSITFDPTPTMQGIFHSSQRAEITQGGDNAMGYISKDFDRTIEKASSEMDEEKRREYVYKAQEILAEDLPYINLYAKKIIEVYRNNRFEGWYPRPLGGIGQASPREWMTYLCLKPVA
jgi:ABC-type transport system substrate-binding protein